MIPLCTIDEIAPFTGAAALVNGRQIALIRHGDAVYALDHFDPFSKAFVIARGIVGDRKGVPVVMSPIYKQAFRLDNGQCVDDPTVSLATWPVKVIEGRVFLAA
jgi:nitrite reductase (NADH) small subunit